MANRHRLRRQQPTTLIVAPTFSQPTATASVYQGSGVGTATDIGTSGLPTQLVFDTSAIGTATSGAVATPSVSPIPIGTIDPKSVFPTSSSPPGPSQTAISSSSSSSRNGAPVLAIVLGLVAVAGIAGIAIFFCYRKRRRGHSHNRVASSGGDVLRKLGPTYDKSDPFSDAHAADPFADPEKGEFPARHNRSGSDSFLSMSAPRQMYTHAASASTGSTASGKARKKELDTMRQQDMVALNNLVRALDQKDRKAEQEGRDRKSLPPIELFKAALVR